MTEIEQLKALLAEVERERDGFQKLAIHYDEVMRKTVEPHLPREADGTPCYGGKTAALHLVEMRDEFTDLRRKLAEAEWERDQWREQAKRGLDSVRRANARVEAMRRELEELKAFAEAHHADQPAHVFLHALTVDIPHRIDAALHAPPAEAAQDRVAHDVARLIDIGARFDAGVGAYFFSDDPSDQKAGHAHFSAAHAAWNDYWSDRGELPPMHVQQGDGERVDVWDDEQDWKCPECGSSAWERDAKPECPTVWCADCSFHTNPGDPDYPSEAAQSPEARDQQPSDEEVDRGLREAGIDMAPANKRLREMIEARRSRDETESDIRWEEWVEAHINGLTWSDTPQWARDLVACNIRAFAGRLAEVAHGK